MKGFRCAAVLAVILVTELRAYNVTPRWFGRRERYRSEDEECTDEYGNTVCGRDPAALQLSSIPNVTSFATSDAGSPLSTLSNSLTVGLHGPIVLQDFELLESLSRLARERIPERAVHARGAGALGYFEVTHDISNLCRAAVFANKKRRTPVVVRFSTVVGESGTAEAVRDVRGFAVKFQTTEGVWDLLSLSIPVFHLRDPFLFPEFTHSEKRNPVTNLRDSNMFWDFVARTPQLVHAIMHVFSDIGIPNGYRYMDGHAINAFKLVNSEGAAVYCRFHWKSNQGVRNLMPEEASKKSPDYATRDLYDAIERGDRPSWKLALQTMSFKEADMLHFNPFDATKVWPEEQFPLQPIGRMTLTDNAQDYFQDVEQVAFSPSRLVPGIQPSPDILLQGRLFIYPDTQRHRLGANYLQLRVNAPRFSSVKNTNRNGPQDDLYPGDVPNYSPSSFSNLLPQPQAALFPQQYSDGKLQRYNRNDEDNYSQPRTLWNMMSKQEQSRLVNNIASDLKDAADFVQRNVVDVLSNVDKRFSFQLEDAISKHSKK